MGRRFAYWILDALWAIGRFAMGSFAMAAMAMLAMFMMMIVLVMMIVMMVLVMMMLLFLYIAFYLLNPCSRSSHLIKLKELGIQYLREGTSQ